MTTTPTNHTKSDQPIREGMAPGPRGWEWLQWIVKLRSDPLEAMQSLVEEYGDIVSFYHPGVRTMAFLVTSPPALKKILQDHQKNYQKARTYRALEPVLGKGLLTSDGSHWLKQRRTIAPMFHRESIQNFAAMMVDQTRVMLERWNEYEENEQRFDLSREMTRLTFGIIGRSLFSADLEGEADRVGESLEILRRDARYRAESLFPMPSDVPTSWNRRVQRAREVLFGIVDDLIEERRDMESPPMDLLTMLLRARDEETGQEMSDKQVRDEVMTFLLAGHETTANALTWTWVLLSRHPDVHKRLHERVRDAGDLSGDPFETLSRLPYLDRVLSESLRLYPPAWAIERTPVEDDEWNGYAVPSGSHVIIPIHTIHHHPGLWEDPERFRPSRFEDDATGGESDFRYLPFGAGGRQCIGKEFARMEARIALALAVGKYRLKNVVDRVEHEAAITLHPDGEVPFILHRWSDTS